jgi:multiple sugar transport system substrate-binding protein
MLKKVVAFIFISLLLCACTRDSREEVTFSSWGSITETKIINTLISEYEKEHPKVKINFLHIPQNYFQKLHLLFASSTAPDVIFINNLYLPVYANHLEDLSSYINTGEYYPQSTEAMTYENKLLAIPRDISNFVVYYNKNITGNINPDWTFDDFISLIEKTTDKNHWGVSYERDIYMASPYTLTLGFDKGMEFYKSIEGKYAPTPADIGSLTLAQMFTEGKLALYISGRWMYPKLKETAEFPFGVVNFPGTVSADSSGWAISKQSKHKAEAIKFAEFLASKQSIDYFTSTGLIVPARKDSAKLIEEKAFLNAIEKSTAVKYDRNFNKIRDSLNKKYFE